MPQLHFIEVFVFTNGDKLKSNKDYPAAKGGDTEAAIRLINEVVPSEKAMQLVKKIPEGTFIVPISAVESTGRNKIPVSLAAFIWSAGQNLKYELEILQSNIVKHTGATAMDRLLAKPEFTGLVRAGANYFIVDDLVTSGSSVNELRHYIQRNGGQIVGAAVLASAFSMQLGYGANIDVQPETIQKISSKFDEQKLNKILNENGIANNYKDLTNAQLKYLSAFSSLDTLRATITQRRNSAKLRTSSGSVQKQVRKGRKL